MKTQTAMMFALALAAAPLAASAHDAHPKTPAAAAASGASAMTPGVVRKVDKETAKVTIQHEAIQSLDMPAMTMVFRVKEAEMLDRINAGDKIRFAAEKIGGQFTVIKVEPAK